MLGLCLYVVLADPAAVGEVRDARSWAPSEARFQELFSDLRMVYPNSLGEEVPAAGEDPAQTLRRSCRSRSRHLRTVEIRDNGCSPWQGLSKLSRAMSWPLDPGDGLRCRWWRAGRTRR